MADKSKYNFPDFIAQNLSAEGFLSENDIKAVETIYKTSEKFAYPDARTSQNWSKIQNRFNRIQPEPAMVIGKKPVFISFTKWAVAAAIVISLTIGIIKISLPSNDFEPMAMKSTDGMKKISLPDGSIAILNTYTEISTNDFDSKERIVNLSGEAYFEVKHSNKTFIVKTDNEQITVLGTKFNVRNRKNMPFQVALSSGSIQLTTPQSAFTMKPGDVLTEGKNSTYLKSDIRNSTLSWLDNKLVFENQPLSEIIAALENQYQVTLEYDTNLNSEKLTLTFNKLNAQQAAELLSKTLNSKVVVK